MSINENITSKKLEIRTTKAALALKKNLQRRKNSKKKS